MPLTYLKINVYKIFQIFVRKKFHSKSRNTSILNTFFYLDTALRLNSADSR